MLLQGIFPAITTPFYPDGLLYLRKLEHNVDRYSRTPVAGMVVLGSTGEAVMLADEERRDVLREASRVAAAEKVLVAGVGSESALETLRLIEFAAGLGYDVALVRTPHYYKPQMKPENVLAFYHTVADRSALPVLLYSVPVFTGYDLPIDIVLALAEHPNIIGIKESGGDVGKIRAMAEGTRHVHHESEVTEIFAAVTDRMRKKANGKEAGTNMVSAASLAGGPVAVATRPTLKTRTKDAGFQVLAGSAQKLLPSLEAGAAGAVLAFAAPAPTACFEIYTAWKERDPELAREKQQRIVSAATEIVSGMGIPGIKYALDFNGYYGGPPRLPLLPPTAETKSKIESLLETIRN